MKGSDIMPKFYNNNSIRVNNDEIDKLNLRCNKLNQSVVELCTDIDHINRRLQVQSTNLCKLKDRVEVLENKAKITEKNMKYYTIALIVLGIGDIVLTILRFLN